MSGKKTHFMHSVDDERPFLQLWANIPDYHLQYYKEKGKSKEKEEQTIIIIDMVNPEAPVCQIDLQ